jgi:hypothetical protein
VSFQSVTGNPWYFSVRVTRVNNLWSQMTSMCTVCVNDMFGLEIRW